MTPTIPQREPTHTGDAAVAFSHRRRSACHAALRSKMQLFQWMTAQWIYVFDYILRFICMTECIQDVRWMVFQYSCDRKQVGRRQRVRYLSVANLLYEDVKSREWLIFRHPHLQFGTSVWCFSVIWSATSFHRLIDRTWLWTHHGFANTGNVKFGFQGWHHLELPFHFESGVCKDWSVYAAHPLISWRRLATKL